MTEKKQYSKSFNIIRWLAPSLVFIAIWFHAFDVYPIGPIFHLSGAICGFTLVSKPRKAPFY